MQMQKQSSPSKAALIIGAVLLLGIALLIGFFLRNAFGTNTSNVPLTTVTPTPTTSATVTVTPTDTSMVTDTPTETATPTPTPTKQPSISNIFLNSEVAANPGNGTSYKFSFTKCANSHCDHYLLPSSKTASAYILSTRTPEDGVKYLISSNTSSLSSAAGSSYFELVPTTSILLGTTFEGLMPNMLSDGKDYYSFSVCSTVLSNCTKYLLDKAKTNATLKAILIPSRNGKTAYITAKTTDGGAAAGTHYYYLTNSGLYIAFK